MCVNRIDSLSFKDYWLAVIDKVESVGFSSAFYVSTFLLIAPYNQGLRFLLQPCQYQILLQLRIVLKSLLLECWVLV